MKKHGILGFMAIMLVGCGSTTYTSAGRTYPSRQPTCDFQVLTTAVPENAMEIGTIDVTNGAYGSHIYRDLSDFKEEIRPYVCQAGGNAVLAHANGYGMWIKASVLRVERRPAPTTQPGATCSPPCSPGYQCSAGVCEALCNPACPSGWVCGPDRTCRGPGDSTSLARTSP